MKRDWMPVVAGVLNIVSGVCAFIGAGAVVFSTAMMNSVPDLRDEDVPLEVLTWMMGSLGVFLAVLGVVSIVGGVFGIRRRGFGWAMAGSIASLFSVMPFGLAALILVLVGEREFAGRQAPEPPTVASPSGPAG